MIGLKPFAAFLIAVTALAACAPVTVLNNITPSSTFDRSKNVSFGDADRDKLDIYRAEEPKDRLSLCLCMAVRGIVGPKTYINS